MRSLKSTRKVCEKTFEVLAGREPLTCHKARAGFGLAIRVGVRSRFDPAAFISMISG